MTSKFKLTQILSCWISLNDSVNGLSMSDLDTLLKLEVSGKNRVSFTKRILIRQNKLIGEKRINDFFKKP